MLKKGGQKWGSWGRSLELLTGARPEHPTVLTGRVPPGSGGGLACLHPPGVPRAAGGPNKGLESVAGGW